MSKILREIDEMVDKFIEAKGTEPKYIYLHIETLKMLQKELVALASVSPPENVNITSYRGLSLKESTLVPINTIYLTIEKVSHEGGDKNVS